MKCLLILAELEMLAVSVRQRHNTHTHTHTYTVAHTIQITISPCFICSVFPVLIEGRAEECSRLSWEGGREGRWCLLRAEEEKGGQGMLVKEEKWGRGS